MKRTLYAFILIIALTVLNSCASIVSKSNWPVHVASDPAGATVMITNRHGVQVYKGTTPVMLTLKSGAGFFKKESYTVHFEFAGYASQDIPLECKVNGWYWGNLLIGGLLGFLVIDPATGAMYKLETPAVDARLAKDATGSVEQTPTLKIANINNLPQSIAKNLVRIN
ncbi:hypothetical protein [Puia dinghuensis]|uniref:PEGA domain-containing protein n=1 Tax=Puia dinghuensis TaxID=1792502 RepID=A0A8J2XR11_9BACT|nr:hypothetical protein [Puia dinghuensis]GGA97563.1 hypothetical protein GCM10011511_21110 [Puia dinghuensis]